MIPRRRKAPKMGVRQSPWWRNHSYGQFIRGFECAVAGVLDPCQGPIESAHVRTVTDGASNEKPSDWWQIPLCAHHHRPVQHQIGEPQFEREYKIDMKATAIKFWSLWPKRFLYPGMGPKLNPLAKDRT